MAKPTQKTFVTGQNDGPVECLGMTFPNDQARREYFLGKLKEKLKDPEFRKIEGFPIGTDEDILAMSDPPYYTACPNPFISDFLQSRAGIAKPASTNIGEVEPYTADVAESRNNPFVNAHSYATKAPHLAIMKYILHYTKPGDCVFDCFSGTGMTAVAAQLCDRPSAETVSQLGNERSVASSPVVWGRRSVVLSDLSPAATFISSVLNLDDDLDLFDESSLELATKVEGETGWMYETKHRGSTTADIHCTLWSDVFVCPECSSEIVYWDSAVDLDKGVILDDFACTKCGGSVGKRGLERIFVSKFDPVLRRTVSLPKQVPVLIVYYVGNKKYEKKPDSADLELIRRIDTEPITDWFPVVPMMHKDGKWGDTWRAGYHAGITHLHHFFTQRNLRSLAAAWKYATTPRLKFMLTSLMYKSSIMCSPLMSNFFAERCGQNRGGWVGKERSGTLFRGSVMSEVPIVPQVMSRKNSVAISARKNNDLLIQTCSATNTRLPDASIDYAFIDPPFGDNRIYSELNFMWEAWHRVFTSQSEETIVSQFQDKTLHTYQKMMLRSLTECYRILRPGKWITVEFSNTSAAVWNAIQTAISEAGFVIADVRSLDKKQGSINAYTTAIAVKQDLVISAYKPTEDLLRVWSLNAGSERGAWEFVHHHLSRLPVAVERLGKLEAIAERQRHVIYDRLLAFHIRNGFSVPLSAPEFYRGLVERYPERDEMFFLPEQVAAYDRKRLTVTGTYQADLFIMDELSAVNWLRRRLNDRPQSRQDLHPDFTKELSGWQKHEKQLELDELLQQNFLYFDGSGAVPSQIHAYLSSNYKELRGLPKENPALVAKAKNRWYVPDPKKESDLEQLRHRALMREFRQYAESKGKLRVVRAEALRAGFKDCWQKGDYETIIQMAKRVPEEVIQGDPALLMYYDNAITRKGE